MCSFSFQSLQRLQSSRLCATAAEPVWQSTGGGCSVCASTGSRIHAKWGRIQSGGLRSRWFHSEPVRRGTGLWSLGPTECHTIRRAQWLECAVWRRTGCHGGTVWGFIRIRAARRRYRSAAAATTGVRFVGRTIATTRSQPIHGEYSLGGQSQQPAANLFIVIHVQ